MSTRRVRPYPCFGGELWRIANRATPSPGRVVAEGMRKRGQSHASRLIHVEGLPDSHVHELVDVEEAVLVRPNATVAPVSRAREILRLAHRVLVRVLGVDGFTAAKVKVVAIDRDILVFQADEVHLDAAVTRVVDGLV